MYISFLMTCVCVYIYMYYIYMIYLYTYIWIYIYIYIYIYICNVYIYICVYMSKCIYIKGKLKIHFFLQIFRCLYEILESYMDQIFYKKIYLQQ